MWGLAADDNDRLVFTPLLGLDCLAAILLDFAKKLRL